MNADQLKALLKKAREEEDYFVRDVARIAVERLYGMDESHAQRIAWLRPAGESPADFCERILSEIYAEGHRSLWEFEQALMKRAEGKSSAR